MAWAAATDGHGDLPRLGRAHRLVHPLQGLDESAGICEALLPVALQGAADHPVELGGHLDPGLPAAQRQRVLRKPLEDEAVLVLRIERRQARDHLVEHQAEGVEVAPVIERHARGHASLLGRAILELAHEHADLGDLEAGVRLQGAGEAEVDDLHPQVAALVLVDHEVVRRQVPVDDARGMDGVQPMERLNGEPDGHRHGKRPLAADAVAHVLPLDVLPDHVEAAVRQMREVVEDGDVGVLDLGGEARLAHEPLLGRGVCRKVLAQDLDHPQLLQVDVADEVHLPHAAAAQALHNLVLAVEDGPRLPRMQKAPPS